MQQTRDISELEQIARRLRLHIVRMVGINQKGHIGGSCSAADLTTALYFSKMRHDPKNPQWPDRDRFLLSKGTAEEHSVIGGLAGLITWVFRGAGVPMHCIGVQDRFGQSAQSYAELQQEYGLAAAHIADAARGLLKPAHRTVSSGGR